MTEEATSTDERETFSFSCIDADARDADARAFARRKRVFELLWPKNGGLFWVLGVWGTVLTGAIVFRSIWGFFAGLAFAGLVLKPLKSWIERRMTQPRRRRIAEVPFTITMTDTALDAGVEGRPPTRVAVERIITIVADDRLRVVLVDGTSVALGCVLSQERLAGLARDLDAAFRRRRSRRADYRGAIRVAEPTEDDERVDGVDPARTKA